MKLHQLAVGARFEYAGQTYVKTGPITASTEEGGSQMIPRHATLKPLDLAETGTLPGLGVRKLDAGKVRKAFDTFYASCQQHLPADSQDALAGARQIFLNALK